MFGLPILFLSYSRSLSPSFLGGRTYSSAIRRATLQFFICCGMIRRFFLPCQRDVRLDFLTCLGIFRHDSHDCDQHRNRGHRCRRCRLHRARSCSRYHGHRSHQLNVIIPLQCDHVIGVSSCASSVFLPCSKLAALVDPSGSDFFSELLCTLPIFSQASKDMEHNP